MHALSTASGDEEDADQATQSRSEVRGLRKRWASMATTQSLTPLAGHEIDADDLFGRSSEEQFNFEPPQKIGKIAQAVDPITVVDVATDDFLGVGSSNSSKPLNSGHKHERDALLSTDLSLFKYPWEKGRLAAIFGPKPTIKVPVPKLQPGGRNLVHVDLTVGEGGQVATRTVLKPERSETAAFMQVVRKVEDIEILDEKAKRRKHALEGFWHLLAFSICSSAVGLKVSVESTADTVAQCAWQILDAIFAVKSAGTLLRRLHALQSYEQWCVSTVGEHWIPVSERRVWNYVQWLQQTNAAATKASSLLALRFSWFLFGVEGASEAEQSLRVKGISSQMRAAKRPWRPADLLTVEEVLVLHKVLGDNNAELGDRLLCGHCLHLLYSRSRWSDLTQVANLFIDEEKRYLEVSTRAHKGARSAEMKPRLLPIVCPCQGISDQNWAVIYLNLRDQANLQLPEHGYGPMMPAPANDSATVWCKRALTSEEGADFMRAILKAPKSAERRVSTHSFKSTLISWTAKYGLPDTSRAVLARHLSCATATTAVYSRDLISPVLRELDTMLQAMRCALFQPDRTRSGMVTLAVMPTVPGTPFRVPPVPSTPMPPVPPAAAAKQADVDEEWQVVTEECGAASPVESMANSPRVQCSPTEAVDSSSETSEEASEQSTSDSDVELEGEMVPRDVEPVLKYFINGKSLVIHCERSAGLLRCGRKVSPHFVVVYELHGIRCSRCFDV